jgi:hypothetical protein
MALAGCILIARPDVELKRVVEALRTKRIVDEAIRGAPENKNDG